MQPINTNTVSSNKIHLLSSSFRGSGVQTQLCYMLYSGPHKAITKVLAMADFFSRTRGPVQLLAAHVVFGRFQFLGVRPSFLTDCHLWPLLAPRGHLRFPTVPSYNMAAYFLKTYRRLLQEDAAFYNVIYSREWLLYHLFRILGARSKSQPPSTLQGRGLYQDMTQEGSPQGVCHRNYSFN